MREYAKKPESQSRTLDSNPKASRQAPIDVILQRYKERNIQRFAEDEELIQGKFETTQCEAIDEDELLQGKFEPLPASKQETIQREEKPNKTGLPDNLKTGIENLSGYSMDDVKVYYNSNKTVQLQALAFTQGTDIHVAPGQEKHLPHEAWHVVQQKQGRVHPTMQLQGVNVNDNEGLEKEADSIGNHIEQKSFENKSFLNSSNPTANVVQGKLYKDPQTAKALIESQIELQKDPLKITELIKDDSPESKGAFTTVGFEHEFAQFTNSETIMHDLTHVELAKSEEVLGFTNIPFILETDADDAIELVSAPFIIETSLDYPIPFSKDVGKADRLIREALTEISKETMPPVVSNTFDKMRSNFIDRFGLNFNYEQITITPFNVNDGATKFLEKEEKTITESDFKDLGIKTSEKGGGISSQVNFATDAITYDMAKSVSIVESDNTTKEYTEKEKLYNKTISNIIDSNQEITTDNNINIFLKELARNLSQFEAVESLNLLKIRKAFLLKGIDPMQKILDNCNELYREFDISLIKEIKEIINTNFKDTELIESLKKIPDQISTIEGLDVFFEEVLNFNKKFQFEALRSKASHVKDTNNFWFKDTLLSFGAGFLTYDQWLEVKKVCEKMKEKVDIASIHPCLDQLIKDISLKSYSESKLTYERPEFGEHNPKLLGARQDTFIPSDKVKRAPSFQDKRLHVVEIRGGNIEEQLIRLEKSKCQLLPKSIQIRSAYSYLTYIDLSSVRGKLAPSTLRLLIDAINEGQLPCLKKIKLHRTQVGESLNISEPYQNMITLEIVE